ncbi:MAG: hypothetical protein ACI840_000239 [Ulvibacter sp.]|jgi:hypothetical protein
MTRLSLIIIAIALLAACGPKTVQQSKKVLKGNWTLDNITYSESGTFNVNMLNDTSKECFEGTNWRFIPNNNSGIYTVNNGDCPTGDRNFIFTIQEVNKDDGLYDFLLKPTDAKHKSTDGNGFRLRLTRLDGDTMQWQQTVSLDGEPFKINMNFSKTEL